MKKKIPIQGVPPHARFKQAQPLTIDRLDKELIIRKACLNDPEFFTLPDTLSPHHESVEIMKATKAIYTEAASESPDPMLSRFSTPDLLRLMRKKARDLNQDKGIRFHDHRMDFYSIIDDRIKQNAHAVAAILTRDQLKKEDRDSYRISTLPLGKALNLCQTEAFHKQPIASGRVATGFLVRKDIIATAAHCLFQGELEDFRFVFGYRVRNGGQAPVVIPGENIYKGICIKKDFNLKIAGKDWALVKLDRDVKGVAPLKLSTNNVEASVPIYIIGHPLGLPLKYAPGACIREIHSDYFISDLDVFSGNSGSPVFSQITHEVVGFVQRGDLRDFRKIGNCWVTMIYPKYEIYAKGAYCITIANMVKNLSTL